MKRFLLITIISASVYAQVEDLPEQLMLIQELLPDATTVGIIWDPTTQPDAESQFGAVSTATGLRVVKTPLKDIRQLSAVMRAMGQYHVSFIYMVKGRMITSKNVIKFVTKRAKKSNMPVFTSDTDTLRHGTYGELYNDDGEWRLRINGDLQQDYVLEIPEEDDRFVVRSQ